MTSDIGTCQPRHCHHIVQQVICMLKMLSVGSSRCWETWEVDPGFRPSDDSALVLVLQANSQDIGLGSSLAVAFLAGCVNVVLTNPIWVVATRMQALQKKAEAGQISKAPQGPSSVARDIWNESGILVRAMPYVSACSSPCVSLLQNRLGSFDKAFHPCGHDTLSCCIPWQCMGNQACCMLSCSTLSCSLEVRMNLHDGAHDAAIGNMLVGDCLCICGILETVLLLSVADPPS